MKKYSRILLGFTALLSLMMTIQAQDFDKNSARDQGGQLGKTLNPGIYQNIKGGNPGTVVPGYGTDPSQKQYFQGGQGSTVGPGSVRVSGCTNQNDVECQAVNLLTQGPTSRPQFNLTRDDPLIRGNKGNMDNPTGQIGDIFSSYDTCKTTTSTLPPIFETQVCNEFSVNEDKVCKMGQEVIVDPNYVYKCLETIQSQANRTCTVGRVVQVQAGYNYQCQQSPKQVQNFTCNKYLVVTCAQQADGCDNGGIVPGTTQGDMRVWFGPAGGGTFVLEFGTFQDNYWVGNGAVFDRTLEFNIQDKDKITQFSLINASYDDWLLVKINGTVVYVGPRGGDRLEVTSLDVKIPDRGYCEEGWPNWTCYAPSFGGFSVYGNYNYCQERFLVGWECGNEAPGRVQYGPGSYGVPELGTSWNIPLNTDLRPFLVNGKNTIFTRTVVGGYGESAIRINARMACPVNCTDNWDNQCQSLEQRS